MNIYEWAGKHFITLLLASVVYMISFHCSFLSFTGIYFYDGILRLLIVTVLAAAVEIFMKSHLKFDNKDICLSLSTFLFLNMLWMSLCVVSLDRSLSVFLLCTMEKYEEGISRETADDIFQEVFVEEYEILDRRFDEQSKSGNITYENGNYVLTSRGKTFVWIFKTVGKLYHVDDRFVNP